VLDAAAFDALAPNPSERLERILRSHPGKVRLSRGRAQARPGQSGPGLR
jgi:hypothetical protein